MNQLHPEAQIDSFTDRYSPEIAARLRACRRRMHFIFPRGFELVYDNYNALVFAFSPTERASHAVLSIAAYPRWITLFFAQGASLPDPMSLLEGKGTKIRGLRLGDAQRLGSAEVAALIERATEPVREAFLVAPRLGVVVKSVSEKRRPRRVQ